MSSFSRLQLAAALIEYDNDDSDPNTPHRSAHDSAIFAHLRRSNGPRRGTASRASTDYLGVALPSEAGSVGGRESVLGGRESVLDGRRSRISVDALQNPFGRDSTYEGMLGEDEGSEEMEVDLTSWGLDSLLPADRNSKDSKGARRKSKPDPLKFSSERPSGLRSEPGRRISGARTMSMGNFSEFDGSADADSKSALTVLGGRRFSVGAPIDLPPPKTPTEQRPPRGRIASSHAVLEDITGSRQPHFVPFPIGESERSDSPRLTSDRTSTGRPLSRGPEPMINSSAHNPTYSTASSQDTLNQDLPNPFAVRPPSPDRTSRFDPKARARSTSYGSVSGVLAPGADGGESNPFALRPPSPSRTSRFDPKVRARTVSNASLGTQMLLDRQDASDGGSPTPRSRPYSRLELMRPKVLIMPSPLQSAPTAPAQPWNSAMEGFQLHASDAAPLPPGARAASRPMSMMDPSDGLAASNLFTPNPRASLTLSQLTFRNTLMVDGQRDPAYADIESHLHRATQDGQQIEPEPEPEPEPELLPQAAPEAVTDPDIRSKRPPGKLYGKNLIDAIEARKAEMRGKQRVFTGDQRPSMMARPTLGRASTLIDPESLKERPQSRHMEGFRSQPNLTRRNSGSAQPLLNFDGENPWPPQPRATLVPDTVHPGSKRSVFGVDTLWERELAKLHDIEEQERVAAEREARRRAEEEERNAKHGKKGRGKRKSKQKGKMEASDVASTMVLASTSDLAYEATPDMPDPRPSLVLPEIERVSGARLAPPSPAVDDLTEEGSSSNEAPLQKRQSMLKDIQADEWITDLAEEDGRGHRRTTSSVSGPANRTPVSPAAPRLVGREDNDDSSEDDLPLVATIGRAAHRMARTQGSDDESEEEKPLSTLLQDKVKLQLPPMSTGGALFPESAAKSQNDDDEDNKPLGLRASRVMDSAQMMGSPSQIEDTEDDQPLAFHPEQMRRTQYFMAQQQQQQQQQQMMMQAQAASFHQSMIFGTPSMMASGFFAPAIPPAMMMMPPQLSTTPPPLQEAAKFGRVDKWRHDVAVEGEP